MNLLINHKRFFKNTNVSKKIKSEYYNKDYISFFKYKKFNFINLKCICGIGVNNDITISQWDRHFVEFETVICKNCGLIRAKKYLKNLDIIDFYSNFYRKKYKVYKPKILYERQFKNSLRTIQLINKYTSFKNKIILDLGGAVGGLLENFDDSNKKYLADFYEPYLNYAKKKGICTIKGGIEKINFKPDIVLLSHVLEHTKNLKNEILKLKSIQKKNTINYIEFPGIDSLKLGRRNGDIQNDIHIPHVYYFSSYVFENIMNRFGFEKLYIDSEIRSIFIYTGKKKRLINFYSKVHKDLLLAEKKRKIHLFIDIIKKYLPIYIIYIIRFLRNKKIKF